MTLYTCSSTSYSCEPNQFGVATLVVVIVVALGVGVTGVGSVGIALGGVAVVLVATLLAVVVVRGGSGGRGSSGGITSSSSVADINSLDSGGLAGDGEAEESLVVLDNVQLLRSSIDLVGSNGSGQVKLVLLDLVLDSLGINGATNLGSNVGLGVGVGLLDSKAATEGTSKGVVTTSDSADVASRSYSWHV